MKWVWLIASVVLAALMVDNVQNGDAFWAAFNGFGCAWNLSIALDLFCEDARRKRCR